jgi:hypothetical protein
MKYIPIIFLILPLALFAQTGPPCTPEIQMFYDDAGNRIQRKEVCDPNGGSGQLRISGPVIEELIVFPNPGSGMFEAKLPSGLQDVTFWVFDSHGKALIEESLSKSEIMVDITAFPAGVYLLSIRAEGFEARKTLIKE